MRVIEDSSDRLVIEDRPLALAVVCLGLFLLLLVLGLGMTPIIEALTGLPPDMMPRGFPGPQLLAYASVVPLLVAVLALGTRRITFDRRAGTIVLARRGALGGGEDTYPLAGFRGAVLQRSIQQTSRTTWAELAFADRDNVRVTPYGTGGNGPARMVDAINAWHMRHGGQAGPDGQAMRFNLTDGLSITISRT